MTLGFSQEINMWRTNFVEKIWAASDLIGVQIDYDKHVKPYLYRHAENPELSLNGDFKPKIHTIRRDFYDRWRAGNTIHAVINNRSKDRFQFLPEFKCIDTQRILIDPDPMNVIIDDKFLSDSEIKELAINDGFDSSGDFWKYFSDPFGGKIIHFTHKLY